MAETTYTYDIAADMPGGKVNPSRLGDEIRAAAQILTALARVDTTGGTFAEGVVTGGTLDVVFKAALSPAEKTALDGDATGPAGGLLAGHDASADVATTIPVEVRPAVGGLDTLMDGGAVAVSPNSWGLIEWTLEEPLHLTGALACWENWHVGDYGFMATINLGAMVTLANTANSGQPVVSFASLPLSAPELAALVGAYDPQQVGSDVWVEFWSMSGGNRNNLVERRKVASVDYVGSTITLDENLSNTHTAGAAIVLPEYGLFTTPRGTKNLDGGIYLVGDGHEVLGSVMRQEATELIPAGLTMAARVKTVNDLLGSRNLSLAYMMRRPVNVAPV